jgi:hypothetical protein
MSNVETRCQIRAYEVNGVEVTGLDNNPVEICSVRNKRNFIEFIFPEGRSVTVCADDLATAIKRCTL